MKGDYGVIQIPKITGKFLLLLRIHTDVHTARYFNIHVTMNTQLNIVKDLWQNDSFLIAETIVIKSSYKKQLHIRLKQLGDSNDALMENVIVDYLSLFKLN